MDAAPAWHVLGDQIEQTTTLGRGGTGVTDVYQVPYVVDSGPAAGHNGSVQIPAAGFNQAAVAAAINAQVGAVHLVAGLTG